MKPFSIGLQIFLLLPCLIFARTIEKLSDLSGDDELLKFPDDLMIGVASSAYQTEGAWDNDGKSPSNWDEYTHVKNFTANADIACDSYHKYKEDIKLAANGNFKIFRMSLSWSRILPTGSIDNINYNAINHYKNVLNEVKKQGMIPFVTLYHWDHPAIFDKFGGWNSEKMITAFNDYARVVFKNFGSIVKFWTTINEPIAYCYYGHGKGYFPPGDTFEGKGPYICGQNMLIAHAQVYHLFKKKYNNYNPNSQIGIVNTCWNFYPANSSESESADIAFEYNCGWLSNPIFSKEGDYPDIMKQRIKENSYLEGLSTSRLPELSKSMIKLIKGTSDYFGLNYYTSRMTTNVKKTQSEKWFDDSGVDMTINNKWKTDAATWLPIVPEGLGDMLRIIKNKYKNPPVYILENGIASDGNRYDLERTKYFYSHMKEMLIAKNRDDCDVKGYVVWSLLDSFEWLAGYSQPFGIVHVDHNSPQRTRTPRTSFYWLKDIIRQRALPSTFITPSKLPKIIYLNGTEI
ncbi:myrosinase 1-like [Aphidius gifuensis]|uniref:myrosinase 1-like n=1 Tax=Aphidius gifuensis TaxID=684658 RepID=UPI001CDBA7B1|nr:myrosinase 1-like [Aphidius gifuensis]